MKVVFILLLLLLVLLLVPFPWVCKDAPFKLSDTMYSLFIKLLHQYKLKKLNVKVCEKNLIDVDAVFTSLGIHYWLSEGTALGVTRENRILPWDDDVDTSIMYEERDTFVTNAIPMLEKEGFTLMLVFNKGNFFTFMRNGERIDVDIVQKNKSCIANMTSHANFSGKCDDIIPYLENMSTVHFIGKTFHVPSHEYLEYLYGDWQTPTHTNKMSAALPILKSSF